MTYKRVINRSGLQSGDYGISPEYWKASTNTTNPGLSTMEELKASNWDYLVKERDDLVQRIQILAGDLRRLEKDAIDEQSICMQIANRTGIDSDTIAAVLKEFMDI